MPSTIVADYLRLLAHQMIGRRERNVRAIGNALGRIEFGWIEIGRDAAAELISAVSWHLALARYYQQCVSQYNINFDCTFSLHGLE